MRADIQIALLRGINVGGHNKLPMAGLRELLTELGIDAPRTYLQSGNVVFESDQSGWGPRMEAGIGERFGLDIPVIVRPGGDVSRWVENNPFPEVTDPTRLAVAVLDRAPSTAAVSAMQAVDTRGDRFEVVGDVVYLHLPNGSARSVLNNTLLERTLDRTVTARNWRTVNALLKMAMEQ